MQYDDRTAYTIILAERGFEIQSLDGSALRLSYDREADVDAKAGKAVRVSDLARYAANMLNQMPDARPVFPGLDHIEVVVAQRGTSWRGDLRSVTYCASTVKSAIAVSSRWRCRKSTRSTACSTRALMMRIENPKISATASWTAMLPVRLRCSTNLDISVSTMTMIPTMMIETAL